MARNERAIRDDASVIDQVIVEVSKMTPAQRLESVIAAGVLTSEGKLAEAYRPEQDAPDRSEERNTRR